MTNAFILRFQEPCVGEDHKCGASGTKSLTGVRAEATDEDPDRPRYGVLGTRLQEAGTQTQTFTAQEGADADPGSSELSAIPKARFASSQGTQTFTRVKGGDVEPDPGALELRAIPQCSTS